MGFVIRTSSPSISYSDYQWNPIYTAANKPWIKCLIYKSTKYNNAYYLAFEDGSSTSLGFNNDGDFNDDVILVTGVVNSNTVCNSLSLSCPETLDISLENCGGIMPNLSSIVTVQSCDTITTWSQSVPIGSSLSIGSSNVTLTIADASSNTNSCRIFIRVKKLKWYKLIFSSHNRQY